MERKNMHTKKHRTKANKRLFLYFSALSVFLLLPLIAMQFTTEVNWNLFDFLTMGILLFSVAIAVEFVLCIFRTKTQRLVLLAIIAILFMVIWAELAVGIFNSPLAGN